MKRTKLLAGFSVALFAALSVQAQTFQNLNFELADIAPGTPFPTSVPISEALPAWSGYFSSGASSYPQTQVVYDGISTGGAVISLVDAQAATPIQGNYSAFLFGGRYGVNDVSASASISQTAIIPAGTQALTMEAWEYDGSPIVAINGQAINMIPLDNISFYTVYGGSIPSSDVGPSVTLSFTTPSGGMFELDDISFSPTVLSPEPNMVALSAIGWLLFGARKWFARRG
ncbi:MAG: hypothetical protein ABSA83_18920 [Verrucomicrobiota bacterium]|jgi:hypothetical protein